MNLQALFSKIIETKVVRHHLKSLWEVSLDIMDNHLHHGHLRGLRCVAFYLNSMGTGLLCMRNSFFSSINETKVTGYGM